MFNFNVFLCILLDLKPRKTNVSHTSDNEYRIATVGFLKLAINLPQSPNLHAHRIIALRSQMKASLFSTKEQILCLLIVSIHLYHYVLFLLIRNRVEVVSSKVTLQLVELNKGLPSIKHPIIF